MPEGPPERDGGEIATSTLAEIYAQQGLLGRALAIYRRMLARAPEDAEIAGRIETLERRIEATEEPEEPEEPASGERPGGEAPDAADPGEPVAPRERLPWDPPEPVAPVASPRVGPFDRSAFEAWLSER